MMRIRELVTTHQLLSGYSDKLLSVTFNNYLFLMNIFSGTRSAH